MTRDETHRKRTPTGGPNGDDITAERYANVPLVPDRYADSDILPEQAADRETETNT